MKKLKLKLMAALMAVVVSFGWVLSPVAVLAEEVSVEEQTSVELEGTQESVEIEETIEEEEIVENKGENSAILESEENTFENFIAWAEKEAERYGYGDEYRRAFEDIKNAATTKQVTISTVVNALLWVVGIAYLVYKKVTDKKKLASLLEIVKQSSAQAQKLNELVDATNDNSKTEEEIKKETEELKLEMKKTNEALAGLINGFMHFAENVKLKETKKDEVRRDCTNALKSIDGEVTSNENNKNNEK